MAIILLRSPFRSYRGTTDFPHSNGRVVFPRAGRHFSRAYVKPTYTNTPLQVQIRAHLTNISQSWQTVSDLDAADWGLLAAALSPNVDADGFDYPLTDQGAFTKINMYRLLNAQAITHVAPEYSNVAAPGIHDVTWISEFNILSFAFKSNITYTGFCFVEVSNLTYSARRSARKNELRIPDNNSAKAFDAVNPEEGGITIYGDTFRFPVLGDERRGFRVLHLSAGYVPGQSDFKTLTIKAA